MNQNQDELRLSFLSFLGFLTLIVMMVWGLVSSILAGAHLVGPDIGLWSFLGGLAVLGVPYAVIRARGKLRSMKVGPPPKQIPADPPGARADELLSVVREVIAAGGGEITMRDELRSRTEDEFDAMATVAGAVLSVAAAEGFAVTYLAGEQGETRILLVRSEPTR